MYIFDIVENKECFKTKNGKIGIVGNESGSLVKIDAIDMFERHNTGNVLVMNFNGIEFIDYTFARQIIYLIYDISTGSNSNILCFARMNDICSTNISASLFAHNLFSCTENGLIGKTTGIDNELYNRILNSQTSVESSELAKAMGKTLQCVNNRLKRLVDNSVISKKKFASKTGGIFNLYTPISLEALSGDLNLKETIRRAK